MGTCPLSEEEAAAWEERLSALGTDRNGDGRLVVRLNQYPTGGSDGDLMYAAASNVKLMADLNACESYFFLLEDPEGFQRDYQVLREGWIPMESGLFLARREFGEDRTPESIALRYQLWVALRKEVISCNRSSAVWRLCVCCCRAAPSPPRSKQRRAFPGMKAGRFWAASWAWRGRGMI